MRTTDGLGAKHLALPLLVIVGTVYGATAVWGHDQNIDAIAAAVPAWAVAETGAPIAGNVEASNPWFVYGPFGRVSSRPPGVWVPAIPLYLAARPLTEGFTYWPATLAAVLAATLTVVVLFKVFTSFTRDGTAALIALLFAFSTATWPISSAQLWPHAALQLLLGVAMLAASAAREREMGLAGAVAALTRPPALIIWAVAALSLSLDRRRTRTVLVVTPLLLLGMGLLAAFNRVSFGSWSLAGGYAPDLLRANGVLSPEWVDRRFSPVSVGQWLGTLAGMFGSPRNGVLWWSPVVLAVLPSVPSGWRQAPNWMRAFALGGVAYVVLHSGLGNVSGDLAFDYRYQLEMLTAATPLLAFCAVQWVPVRTWRRNVVAGAAAASVVLQAMNAIVLTCSPISDTAVSCGFYR